MYASISRYTYAEKFYGVLWYPALGLALLLAHILIENPLAKMYPGTVRSRPFLFTAVFVLITSPLIILSPIVLSPESGWMLALGLMVLSYTIAGILALKGALKVFEE